ncbi:MAG: ligand-binding sensor domain-containing protein, partial [Owenweeksia sp.]
SCNAQTDTREPAESQSQSITGDQPLPLQPPPISDFVRRIFQDQNGDLWLGTNGDGVIRYNGDTLQYFSINEGFVGVAVRGIIEDKEGNVWFGTERGISKYNPHKTGTASFTNFTEKDGLIHNDVWSMTIDSKGIIWIGTLQGVCFLNPAVPPGNEVFTPFNLPETSPDYTRGVTSTRIVHCILEDRKGKMWFATNGGVYIHNSSDKAAGLTHISEEDGLCNNVVNCILEDRTGNIWFATHHNGVCYYSPSDGLEPTPEAFTHINTRQGVQGTEVWDLYEDSSGRIWFPVEGFGVYQYNPSTGNFTNFSVNEGLTSKAIQCTFEDQDGKLWLGGWQGLFRYNSSGKRPFFSVSQSGPWE